MQARTPKSAVLATLVALLAPALSQAYDHAPDLPTVTTALSPLPKFPVPDVTSLKTKSAKLVDEEAFREKDVWGRIRSGYAIPDVNNDLVAKHVNWYATRPDYIARTTARASLYLFHVVSELEKRGMPTELALLPFIESAFNPNALSNANAAGIWQFVPGTGRDFNLKQDAFKDERRGILASTDAALTYLQRLYDMFGDWQLALAAYNWGEGSVQKAIKRNQAAGKPTDFESLADLMPAETRNYVPKLQAVKNIVANPQQYGLSLPVIDNSPYFTAVDKTSDIDLTVAAHLAELSVDEFKALNPQFKRPVIVGGEDTKILLPKENAEKFHLNLAQWTKELSTWSTHKITSARESIRSLASRFHTSPEVIRQANNIPQNSVLKAGSTILVPKISASAGDITPDVADTANVAYETERASAKPAKGYKLVKARVHHDSNKKHRKAN
ncbi:membrane-bound lytic murein transglycosylase D [Duganella sp. 1224]|uniref:transglycosylase SLT domain-containing protein n=1 Tax=Duganella sp. 1224 TaxID=2587052 RepID=UPI0015CE92E3|nr:transglycosylase SLT domain-containing protein [Duganella sp. 1224]NYE60868.1 membrane-bound lytic murein transglycosylase D [Duganella sp. 1224]